MNCTYPITCYEMSIIHIYCFYTLLIETSFLDKQCLNIIIIIIIIIIIVIIIIINIYNNITVLTTTSKTDHCLVQYSVVLCSVV